MTTHKLAMTVAMLAGFATACGGSSSGKLASRVDTAHLAPVSAADRAREADAQRDFFLSEWQLAFTESQLRGAKLDIGIAKNELASAKLTVKNAKLELKAAEETGDQNAIAKATQAERVAHLRVEERKIAIERAKQNKRYLEKRLVHEQRDVQSREAGVELARAESLKAAGIKPPNFDAKRYKGQHAERVSNAKATKGGVDAERTKLTALDKRLRGAKNAVLSAEGKPTVKETPVETKPMDPIPKTPPVNVKPTETTPDTKDGKTGHDDATDGDKKTETKKAPTTPAPSSVEDTPDADAAKAGEAGAGSDAGAKDENKESKS